jgi:hypothetical protein
MVRRLILVVCLALVACGNPVTSTASQEPNPTVVTEEPTEAPTEAATEVPTEAATEAATEAPMEPIPWDNPYDPSSYDDPNTELLCPEDGPADAPPVFGDVIAGRLEDRDILIRHGLYVNAQNEIFRIDVIAPSTEPESSESLNQYTNEVIVCFDHILLTVITEPIAETPPEGGVTEPFGSSPADLAIEVYMQGYAVSDMPREAVWEILARIVKEPVEAWPELFRGSDLLTPQDFYPDKVHQDFLIAYIFDPEVAPGATHDYAAKSANSIYVTADVGGGGGSVTAGLCRNSSLFATITITNGGTATGALSDTQSSNYTYDLGVRGESSGGTYRISGLWGVPGWTAEYWDSAPTGYSCNP